MSTQRFRETSSNSFRLLLLVLRHILAAPTVSFVFSFATLIPGIFLIAIFGQHFGRALCFTLVGFVGVFMGARCMLPRARGWGAICLTLLGMIYYSGYIAEWGSAMTDEGKLVNVHDQALVELILLGFGGLLATTLIWRAASQSFQQKRGSAYGPDAPLTPPEPHA